MKEQKPIGCWGNWSGIPGVSNRAEHAFLQPEQARASVSSVVESGLITYLPVVLEPEKDYFLLVSKVKTKHSMAVISTKGFLLSWNSSLHCQPLHSSLNSKLKKIGCRHMTIERKENYSEKQPFSPCFWNKLGFDHTDGESSQDDWQPDGTKYNLLLNCSMLNQAAPSKNQ